MPAMYKNFLIKIISVVLIVCVFSSQLVLAVEIVSQPEDVTVSAIVGSVTPPPGEGGGGGGGDYTFRTSVSFSGFAYPGAIVHIWKDATPKTTAIADNKGVFSTTLDEPYSDSALYTLYAVDREGRRSLLLNYPIVISSGYFTSISGVRFPPTIVADKTEVKFGDSITISGYALPNENIQISINGMAQYKTIDTLAKSDGIYSVTYSLSGFYRGEYNVKVNYKNDKRSSKIIKFIIGELNVLSIESVNNLPGDCNADQIINIIDFSILAFWYNKNNPPACVDTNQDNIINIVDFSILAFYWTG